MSSPKNPRNALLRATLLVATCSVGPGQVEAIAQPLPHEQSIPTNCDLGGSFTFRMCVRLRSTPSDLPTLAANKPWEAGPVRDYTTNNSYGLGRESGARAGFAISVLPDGAWTWNAGDGKRRIDHRPEGADQGIADGRWHEVGFAVDRPAGVVHLYHDGRRVALHDLQGVGSLASEQTHLQLGSVQLDAELGCIRWDAACLPRSVIQEAFVRRFGSKRAPTPWPEWNGHPLRVLAWNIWHGGRRKGRDEGVQRVVEIIQRSRADIVLMQETYGSGPRISGRLGFDYFLRSSNLSIMSRYPIVTAHRLGSGFRFGGATIQLLPGRTVQAYSLWIDYLPSVRKQLEAGTTADQLRAADARTRGQDIDTILTELQPHLAETPRIPVLVGGDFNSGSHLDWTQQAAHLDNHQGLVVDWPVSRAMANAGFTDTFRSAHPDPVAAPGHTWSPEFRDDHQDRIDYVYVRGDPWRVLNARVLSSHPRGWPSDHAAVLATLDLAPPDATATESLRVMSYNIHYGVGMDGERNLERIAHVIRDHAPDLVGLQEIRNEAMANELGKLTGMSVVFGPSKGNRNAYGDAILCRHPFSWVGNHAIPSASSSRYQAMAIDVDVSSILGRPAQLRFINTHFDWLDTLGSRHARLAACALIEEAFCSPAQHPLLLAGDLNATPDAAPLRKLQAAGWDGMDATTQHFTIGAPRPDRQIDYVLARPNNEWRISRTYVVDAPIASDHLPIVSVLERAR